jgi:hypothetical protein
MLLKTLFGALVALTTVASQAYCQLSYQNTSFESLAIAETDAGPEYSYIINRADEVEADGTYTYSESGSAPGYSSSASVTVEHASELRPSGFHLTGKARGYVADDYGYAACSANSESLVYFTFTLNRARRVSVAGVFALTGSSPPESYSNYFEIRRSNGTLVKSSSDVGSFSYNGRLTAGTYSVYVSSQVLREINFSGGDVYENSTASFDVELTTR